jgi:glycosyltransferase involved in cell wall biosynthesis
VPHLASTAVDRFLARGCDVVGAVSQSEADRARELGAKRVAVVANGIPELDVDVDAPAPTRPRPLVLAGGRLTASRRPAETARILHELLGVADVGWVGGGAPSHERAVTELGVPVTGWLPHDEAMARLHEATAYLHWSSADGQSIAVLEAVARDVVVVASDLAANRELLDDRQLCHTEAEAAALLHRLVGEPGLRTELVASQRARAGAHGADAMVSAWTDLYHESIREASAATR